MCFLFFLNVLLIHGHREVNLEEWFIQAWPARRPGLEELSCAMNT